jgi:hypothetical protein
MENEFDEIMRQHSDAELIEILNSESGDYKDSAMEAARREFKSRNLSAQKVKEINEGIEQQKYEEDAALNAPPDRPSRLLAFFLPGLWQIFLSDGSYRDRELASYTLFGYIFYGCIIALFLILRYYFHF